MGGIAGTKHLRKNCTFCHFVLLCLLFWLNWEFLVTAEPSAGITAWDGSAAFALGF